MSANIYVYFQLVVVLLLLLFVSFCFAFAQNVWNKPKAILQLLVPLLDGRDLKKKDYQTDLKLLILLLREMEK